MAEGTSIEWAAITLPDGTVKPGHTFNPWHGCQKVSPGCDHCYAETMDARFGHDIHWGPHAQRLLQAEPYWTLPARWNRRALREGGVHRVFCGSMCDVFDNKAPAEVRLRLWQVIRETPALTWLLLTKRPENIRGMLPPWWPRGGLPNVVAGCTVEDGVRAHHRLHHFLHAPFQRRFLSLEPLLGFVNLARVSSHHHGAPWLNVLTGDLLTSDNRAVGAWPKVDWVICGGESGHEARPAHPDWIRQVRDQCEEAGTPFLFKQWGAWGPVTPGHTLGSGTKRCIAFTDGTIITGPRVEDDHAGRTTPYGTEKCGQPALMACAGKRATGNLLDGRQYLGFPAP